MITGIDIYESKPYVSKFDPDKTNPTTFNLGVLDSILRAHIDDQATFLKISSKNPNDAAEANILTGKRNLLVVKFGLRGIENFIHPDTKQSIKFDSISVSVNGKNYQAVTEEIVKMIPKEVIDEIAEKILDANKLSEEAAKN